MLERHYANLRLLAEPVELRAATLHGVDYLVVPIVALRGDVVVWPMGAEGPELVPAKVLEALPEAWNGSPVVVDHPTTKDGRPQSANDPEVLEAMGFGFMFGTVFRDGQLGTEAYLDPLRADAIGEDAQRVLKAAEALEPFEVSVGGWVSVRPEKGTHQGEDYIGVWVDVRPDHLAAGLRGKRGACSVDMGCGGPRVYSFGGPEKKAPGGFRDFGRGTPVVLNGVEEIIPIPGPGEGGGLAARLSFRAGQQNGGSMFDFRTNATGGPEDLEAQLADVAHNLEGVDLEAIRIEALYDDRFVYRSGEAAELWQRGYSIESEGDDEKVQVTTEREEVERGLEYTPKPTGLGRLPAALAAHVGQVLERFRSASDADHLEVPDLATIVRLAGEDGMSDTDTRRALERALFATEPAFLFVDRVFPESGRVVYALAPDDSIQWFRRSYSIDDAGEVTLADDREEVTPVTDFQPVAAAAADDGSTTDDTQAEPCNCNQGTGASRPAPNQEEPDMSQKLTELAGRLIASEHTPFQAGQEEQLAGLGEATLEQMLAQCEAANPPAEPADPPATDPPVAPELPAGMAAISAEDLTEFNAMKAERQARLAQQRAELTGLISKATDAYSAEDLGAMEIAGLEKLAKALGVDQQISPDFKVHGMPLTTEDGGPKAPPKPYTLALQGESTDDGKPAN